MAEYKIPISKTDYTKISVDANIKACDYGSHTFIFEFEPGYDKAVLKFKRADGCVIAVEIPNGTYTLSGSEIDIAGTVQCEISFYTGSSRITTNTFEFSVISDISTENTIGKDPKIPILDSLLKEVTQGETQRDESEQIRISNENLRISAENERSENESKRISAENERETRFSEISEQFDSLITKNEALKLLCIKGSVKSESGTVTLSDHLTNEKVIDYKIYGNLIQDGTPTPDNPIDIQSVGDLVTDTESEHYGKYKIPIIVRGENESDINYIEYIYLDNPLRKVGNSYDYVDFKNKKVVRNIKQEILSTTLPRFNFSSSWDTELLTTFYYKPEDIDTTAGTNTLIVCNYFKRTGIYGPTATEPGLTTNINGYIYCKIPKSIATNKDELNTWLNSLGENVELYYSLTEPSEENIELPELTTINSEIMNVVADTLVSPSSIEMMYYQDITTVINNKFNELQNAIITLGGNE